MIDSREHTVDIEQKGDGNTIITVDSIASTQKFILELSSGGAKHHLSKPMQPNGEGVLIITVHSSSIPLTGAKSAVGSFIALVQISPNGASTARGGC